MFKLYGSFPSEEFFKKIKQCLIIACYISLEMKVSQNLSFWNTLRLAWATFSGSFPILYWSFAHNCATHRLATCNFLPDVAESRCPRSALVFQEHRVIAICPAKIPRRPGHAKQVQGDLNLNLENDCFGAFLIYPNGLSSAVMIRYVRIGHESTVD